MPPARVPRLSRLERRARRRARLRRLRRGPVWTTEPGAIRILTDEELANCWVGEDGPGLGVDAPAGAFRAFPRSALCSRRPRLWTCPSALRR